MKTAFVTRRINALRSAYSNASPGGPVNVEFTGPDQLLDLIGMIPGLRKNETGDYHVK